MPVRTPRVVKDEKVMRCSIDAAHVGEELLRAYVSDLVHSDAPFGIDHQGRRHALDVEPAHQFLARLVLMSQVRAHPQEP